MVPVASLLNPLPTPLRKGQPAASPMPKSVPVSSTSTAFYGNKMSKSAAVFFKGRTMGAINYKPCEIQNEAIAAEHRKFHIESIGCISDDPRHIPYSSDKKSFQKKTGRDAFEGKKIPSYNTMSSEAYDLQRTNTRFVCQGKTRRKTHML